MPLLGNEHIFWAASRKTSAKGLLANHAHAWFLQRELDLPFSIFHPKKTHEQVEPCGSLGALEYDFLSVLMENENKEFGIRKWDADFLSGLAAPQQENYVALCVVRLWSFSELNTRAGAVPGSFTRAAVFDELLGTDAALGRCRDPAQKEQGGGLRFVPSFSYLSSPSCCQLNVVAENSLRQCRVFTCSSYSCSGGCWPAWSRLDSSRPRRQVVSPAVSFLATGDTKWPVLCSSATQGKERLLPCHAGHFRAVSASFSCLFLLLPFQIFSFSLFIFSLLNGGKKVQGDFLR